MDLATTYLGLPLAHPLITGASPLVDHMDLVRRLEDAGAAAITMHSLFEEQLAMDAEATRHALEAQAYSHPEAESYFPLAADYTLGPDEYLEQIHRIKAAVRVPVIASLNGVTGEGWTGFGGDILEPAVAHVLEEQRALGVRDAGEEAVGVVLNVAHVGMHNIQAEMRDHLV